MTLARRIVALEAQPGSDDDETVEWGPAHAHLPQTTKGALREMLKVMHNSGSGRLPIRRSPGTATNNQKWVQRWAP